MKLFSEVYGCYYSVVAKILNQAQNDGILSNEMEQIVQENAFYDSTFYLLPHLISGEWDFLEERDRKFFSKINSPVERPMTALEKSWIVALLNDKRIRLFIDEKELTELKEMLPDVLPLFIESHFHIFDAALDGDDFEDERYIQHFRMILSACKKKQPLQIVYKTSKGKRVVYRIIPWKLSYSERDDKFRLLGCIQQKHNRVKNMTLNLSRIISIEIFENSELSKVCFDEKYLQKVYEEPILLKISKERNALERCMLQFASWEKQTEYREEEDCYYCKVFFDPSEESELLIRILSFGPVIQVLGPENFLSQVRERVRCQSAFFHTKDREMSLQY